jgi:EAL domain-containing protein (putative c-di-GMP-specific phosphodiesterase class I)
LKEVRAALKSLDIGLAFDDFGSGQTRLAELAVVHPDYIKFDISLIRSIDAHPERQEMVATLVRMVKRLGLIALAEGVETKEECAACVEIGFDLAQGYYFGRPAPLSMI